MGKICTIGVDTGSLLNVVFMFPAEEGIQHDSCRFQAHETFLQFKSRLWRIPLSKGPLQHPNGQIS